MPTTPARFSVVQGGVNAHQAAKVSAFKKQRILNAAHGARNICTEWWAERGRGDERGREVEGMMRRKRRRRRRRRRRIISSPPPKIIQVEFPGELPVY